MTKRSTYSPKPREKMAGVSLREGYMEAVSEP